MRKFFIVAGWVNIEADKCISGKLTHFLGFSPHGLAGRLGICRRRRPASGGICRERAMLQEVLEWLRGPDYCYLCGGRSGSGLICQICRDILPGPRSACLACGAGLSRPADACGACLNRRLPYARVWCPMDYRFPVDRLVQALKFHGDLVAGRVLAALLTGPDAPAGPDPPRAIVPMPLHARRQRARGYNQCSEIGRHLARQLDLPLLEGRLLRWRHDPPQSGLSALQRKKNVRGAYRVKPRSSPLPESVLLLDDVITTGATVDAASRALVAAGVRRVEVWAVARAVSGAGRSLTIGLEGVSRPGRGIRREI
jgi:ComF family protein